MPGAVGGRHAVAAAAAAAAQRSGDRGGRRSPQARRALIIGMVIVQLPLLSLLLLWIEWCLKAKNVSSLVFLKAVELGYRLLYWFSVTRTRAFGKKTE